MKYCKHCEEPIGLNGGTWTHAKGVACIELRTFAEPIDDSPEEEAVYTREHRRRVSYTPIT